MKHLILALLLSLSAVAQKPIETLTDAEKLSVRTSVGLNIGQLSDEAIVMGPVLPRTIKRTQEPNAFSAFNLTCIQIGDSFCEELEMKNAAGVLGRSTAHGGGATYPFYWAGTAGVNSTHDFTRSPNGAYFEVDAGETVILSNASASWIRNFHVFYTAENLAGTFKVEQDIGAGYVSISAPLDSIDTNNGGAITPLKVSHDFTTSALRKLRITGISGRSRIWGFCADDRYTGSKGGFAVYNFAVSGSQATAITGVAQPFLTLLYGTLLPDFIVWKSNSQSYKANLLTLVANVKTATGGTLITEPDWILVGPHPTNDVGKSNDRDLDPEQDVELIAVAKEINGTFINSRNLIRSHAFGVEIGMIPDGLHLGPNTAGAKATVGAIGMAIHNVLGLNFSLNRSVPAVRQAGFADYLVSPSSTGAATLLNYSSLAGTAGGTSLLSMSTTSATQGEFKLGAYRGFAWNTDQNRFSFWGRQTDLATRSPGSQIEVGAGQTYNVPLSVHGVTGQTANLLELYVGSSPAATGTVRTRFDAQGSLWFDTGAAILMKNVANGAIGTGVTLVAGTKDVANTGIWAGSHIILTKTAHGGTAGNHYIVSKTNAVKFTITAVDNSGATVTTDTSTFDWFIMNRH